MRVVPLRDLCCDAFLCGYDVNFYPYAYDPETERYNQGMKHKHTFLTNCYIFVVSFIHPNVS